MSCTCGCCEGVRTRTPLDTYNPPGRSAIGYRIGTHGTFRESMQARLSASAYGRLSGLTTRDPNDPSIALLDCFALIGDILTFYQERIANEGYLRTATEPSSLAELGTLVGHHPRPALGSATHLAYTLDPDATKLIPTGSGARSVPRQNELPQTFETSEDLDARAEWNTLQPAMTDPPVIAYHGPKASEDPDDVHMISALSVAGTAANLKTGDRLLFLFGPDPDVDGEMGNAVRVVSGSKPDFSADKAIVSLVSSRDPFNEARNSLRNAVQAALSSTSSQAPSVVELKRNYLAKLNKRLNANNPLTATEIFQNVLDPFEDTSLPTVIDRLAEARALATVHESGVVVHWYSTNVQSVLEAGTHLVRIAETTARRAANDVIATRELAHETLCPASPSRAVQHNDCEAGAALVGLTPVLPWLRRPPLRPPRKARDADGTIAQLYRPDSDVHAQLLAAADPRLGPNLHVAWMNERLTPPSMLSALQVLRTKATVGRENDETREVSLDTVYDGIQPGSWVIVGNDAVRRVDSVEQRSRTETVGETTIEIPSTVLTLNAAVRVAKGDPVYAQGETLTPVGDPITDDIAGDELELSRVYDGLQPGRWLIVSGERTDVPHTSGIRAAELTMVAAVRQHVDPNKPGSSVRTFLQLTDELSYRYRRDTVTVYGNVVEATQGETRKEILGSADASRPNQSFRIRQANQDNPLTALPSTTPDGADTVLDVAVSGVRWRPTEILAAASATDRVYRPVVGADKSVEIQFGDGIHGARPQTGTENVTATLRVGAGCGGNVVAGQISQLTSQPLGVGAVTNPIAATGGADGDHPDEARMRTPLGMLALDRLVSVRDYEDLTHARAGIGKASARKLFDGYRQVVHVTIAGIGDAPIDPQSGLIAGLEESLAEFGDIGETVRVDIRDLVLLVLRAGIKVDRDHTWDLVEPAVRTALLDTFSFARRDLAQDAYLSEAITAAQAVPGVDYVDVDVFHGLTATITPIELVTLADQLTRPDRMVRAHPAKFVEDRVDVLGGESLTQFALRVGLTVVELCRLNPELAGTDLANVPSLRVYRGIRPAEIVVLPPGVPEALTLRRIP